MRVHPMFQRLVALIMVLTLSIPFTTFAQESTVAAVAKAAAIADVNKDTYYMYRWLMMGCALSVIGVAIAKIRSPRVPAERLIGKSPEYIEAYTKYYQEQGKRNQLGAAILGAVTGGACLIIGIREGEAALDAFFNSCSGIMLGF